MTAIQKVIKYLAVAFAILLVVTIFSGILGTVGVFSGVFGRDGVAEEVTPYPVSSKVVSLKVDVGAADFTVGTADQFLVESNLKGLKVEEKDGTLTITQRGKIGTNYRNPVLNLWIPEGYCFQKADITTGAGRLTVDTLSAEVLDLELGAGQVTIDRLNASAKASIEGGAGKVTISGGTLRDLDLEMGVGQLNLTAAILGRSELDYGVGEANLTLVGGKEDYKITFDKGLGAGKLDGEDMVDGGVYGDGENLIAIEGGVGAVQVDFCEESPT